MSDAAAGRRIAFFLPRFGAGGVERFVSNMARGLLRRGFRVDVVTFAPRSPRLSLPEPVTIVDLGARRTLGSILPLLSYLRRARPMGIISAHAAPNLCALLAGLMTSTRVVVTERLSLTAPEAIEEHWIRAWLTRLLVSISYPRAAGIVAVSHGVAEELRGWHGFTRDRVSVIYNPLDREALTRLAREPVDHPWFSEGGLPILIAVSRLEPQKDHELLLAAFSRLLRRRDARLVILGEGSQRPRIEQLLALHAIEGKVSMLGHQENPYRFMSRSTALVHSSRYEGLANVLVEAMALGVPVVATECPTGTREVLAGGKAGMLVPMGDARALAAAMESVICGSELRETYRRAAQRVLERFDPETAISRYLDLLEAPTA